MHQLVEKFQNRNTLFITAVVCIPHDQTIQDVKIERLLPHGPKAVLASLRQVIELLKMKILIVTLVYDSQRQWCCAVVKDYDTKTGTFIRTVPDKIIYNNLEELPRLPLLEIVRLQSYTGTEQLLQYLKLN